jgi:hypothetical protein
MSDFEQLEDFVKGTLTETSKPFGRNTDRNVKENEDDAAEDFYRSSIVSIRSSLGNSKRNAKVPEVWTQEQKDMLKHIDEIINRPIPRYEE